MSRINEAAKEMGLVTDAMPLDTLVFGMPCTLAYKNHRAECSTRVVVPHRLVFTATPHHPEPQWILECFDVAKKEHRSFALKDIETK